MRTNQQGRSLDTDKKCRVACGSRTQKIARCCSKRAWQRKLLPFFIQSNPRQTTHHPRLNKGLLQWWRHVLWSVFIALFFNRGPVCDRNTRVDQARRLLIHWPRQYGKERSILHAASAAKAVLLFCYYSANLSVLADSAGLRSRGSIGILCFPLKGGIQEHLIQQASK
jgi:hypothetical protein